MAAFSIDVISPARSPHPAVNPKAAATAMAVIHPARRPARAPSPAMFITAPGSNHQASAAAVAMAGNCFVQGRRGQRRSRRNVPLRVPIGSVPTTIAMFRWCSGGSAP
jgi:hypothetical protein